MTASPNRGNAYGIDAIRYGRCTLQVTAGDGTEYGRFDVMAEFNDKNTTAARTGFTLKDSGYHRLGIFQYQDGVYKWQGHLLLGTAGTAVDFRDSNRAIFVLNTKHVTANFNLIEVRHASSRVDWTGISISALGTKSKGRFLMTDNADVNWESNTFTDMDTFVFLSNATINASIFRRCGTVTLGGAVFTKCIFDQPSGSVGASATSLAQVASVSSCSFNSDGTGHAIEVGGSAADITLSGNVFTGYAGTDGSTGNEAIYVNIASGIVNITIGGTGNTPSIRTAGATVNVISGATVTFTGLPSGTDIVILTAGTTTILQQVDQNSGSSFAWGYSGTPTVDVGFIKPGYKVRYLRSLVLGSSDSTIPVELQADATYQ